MSDQVFLSYSRHDRPYVSQLAEELAKAGVKLWWDQQIEPGVNWSEAIINALQGTKALIVVYGHHESEFVKREALHFAGTQKRPILPLLLPGVSPDSLPINLRSIQALLGSGEPRQDAQSVLKWLRPLISLETVEQRLERKNRGFVFFSYAIEDESFVEYIAEMFAKRDFGFWDFRRQHRNYSEGFDLELEATISACEALISVQSPDWKKSIWCKREFLYAEATGKKTIMLRAKIMPVAIMGIEKSYIDFTGNRSRAEGFLMAEMERLGL